MLKLGILGGISDLSTVGILEIKDFQNKETRKCGTTGGMII